MSYLNSPRLTFSGQFQADPSTVNNDPTHFNNVSFRPEYQQYTEGKNANGWWNPDGTGNWRFLGCTVKSVTYLDGTSTFHHADDPIIGMSIMDSDSKVCGKIVDLDSQQQGVSALWGLIVRLVSGEKDLFKADYEVAAFTNLWFTRSLDQTHDGAASATYQSILKNITWDLEESNSRYLKELFGCSPDQLSIQFTVDRYNGDHTSPQFTLGRIVGSIGPSTTSEPKHFTVGRQFFPTNSSISCYASAVLDSQVKCLSLDLSNSFQFDVDKATGHVVLAQHNKLILAVDKGATNYPDYEFLANIPYHEPDWYLGSSGVCSIPLSETQFELAEKYPLVIVTPNNPNDPDLIASTKQSTPVFQEFKEYVCADYPVFYLNPGESCEAQLYASSLGKPLPNRSVSFARNINALGPNPPVIGVPVEAIDFPETLTTDAEGKLSLPVKAGDPGNPRSYIDGQVYGIAYNLSNTYFSNCNQNNFISLLVFDSVEQTKIDNPTWSDLQPTMQQYANLYPLMSKGIFNLADQEVVDKNAEILKFVFGKEKSDPNYMPVTRDLSRDKQQMILNYLDGILSQTGKKDEITYKKL
ncbi:hypothetical protein [Algoriphagus yeomjeoni]|uniref:Uncharacterized protein n=1 Tax=Algoriphagus yeomjeoni TaxID=291403 RepID=A0A327PF91_9BACT|nr:hypothetical protein [Algoriphagus yeomjeoni]RAI90117.1 hypothetical protein LV83_02124 [Algoriphagus yeomjeoni]